VLLSACTAQIASSTTPGAIGVNALEAGDGVIVTNLEAPTPIAPMLSALCKPALRIPRLWLLDHGGKSSRRPCPLRQSARVDLTPKEHPGLPIAHTQRTPSDFGRGAHPVEDVVTQAG